LNDDFLWAEPPLLRDGILRFPNRWIGRGGPRPLSARSPDLTPLHFFAWGFIKSEAYRRNNQDLPQLRNGIREAVPKITPEMLANMFRNAAD
jgi:hypothetical protein